MDYPRVLRDVLDAATRARLTALYQRNKGARSPYLHVLASTLKQTDEAAKTREILKRLLARVQAQFRGRFVLISDLFSWRDSAHHFFNYEHQDSAFWMTGGACSSFNLWLLLDHVGMAHSFDIFDPRRQPAAYEQHCPYASQLPFYCGPPHQRWPRRRTLPNVTSVPMRPGDAVVVRQPEVHMTDGGQLADGQWRLAISLKFVERVPIIANSTGVTSGGERIWTVGRPESALAAAHAQLVNQHPQLPRALPGLPHPDWYALT